MVPDMLLWLGAQSGRYSVSTGYEALMGTAHGEGSSERQPYWPMIWGLEVIPQIKLFL
jgi:hypothetical protein